MGGPSKGWKKRGVESIVYRVVRSGLCCVLVVFLYVADGWRGGMVKGWYWGDTYSFTASRDAFLGIISSM